MDGAAENEKPVDARVVRTRAAVLKSAAQLLIERGVAAFTVESVVERTGIALTTIYRHWPTRHDLLIAAIAQLAERPDTPDTGALRSDLYEFLTRRAHAMESDAWDHRLQTLPGLIEAGQRDPRLGTVITQVVGGVLKAIRLMLERGQARGEVRKDHDLDAMCDVVLGGIFLRRAHRGEQLTDQYINEVVDTVIGGLAPRR